MTKNEVIISILRYTFKINENYMYMHIYNIYTEK